MARPPRSLTVAAIAAPEERRPRRLPRLLALPVVVLALALGPFATSASAADREFLDDYAQLTPLPAPVTPPEKCVQRHVQLEVGTYAWSLLTPGGNSPAEDVQLPTDGYTWRMCLSPRIGAYNVTTTLTPDTAGRPTRSKSALFGVDSTYIYTWGSQLYRWKPGP
ncbi:hypothetical protein [Kitasatospora sp. NPDC092286]|uniref:hypothetical protein n=1 Tax=Kitasatospora sp. NPDC092286 TaxID=3364087 RepID=UPI00381CF32F